MVLQVFFPLKHTVAFEFLGMLISTTDMLLQAVLVAESIVALVTLKWFYLHVCVQMPNIVISMHENLLAKFTRVGSLFLVFNTDVRPEGRRSHIRLPTIITEILTTFLSFLHRFFGRGGSKATVQGYAADFHRVIHLK